tara:strand:+ start:152 stop:418 length:267 start_codon:yes stop_codon:yes gene_type:complete
MFTINLPPNPKLEDFIRAKNDLHIQHLKKVGVAPDKDQYAYGTQVAVSGRRITAKFRNMLRSLDATCLSITGKNCLTVTEMDKLEDIG